jgi:predicted NAD/FAD-dependent oxidoreductase
MLPCWALMAVLDRPLLAENDAAFINQGPLSWVASQSARPGRPGANAWVLHASPEWSLKHLDRSAEDVAGLLLEAAGSLPQVRRFKVKSAIAHRWRYALARQPLDVGALWFGSRRLAFAGDWCHGSRVEGAFLSGTAAAREIIGSKITRG